MDAKHGNPLRVRSSCWCYPRHHVAGNLRCPFASVTHANIGLALDQTLESLTAMGAPPWTQPRDELRLDTVEKGIYALTTGLLADTMIEPLPNSSARRRGLGLRLKGRAYADHSEAAASVQRRHGTRFAPKSRCGALAELAPPMRARAGGAAEGTCIDWDPASMIVS
jgi:hypothetical protein